jgi:chemotaxis protein CheZ
MAKPVQFDESGDSEDLQALFDSIAAGSIAAEPLPSAPDNSGDSDELQALFDSVSAQAETPFNENAEQDPEWGRHDTDGEVFNRLGHMARQLHESLRQLGYDKTLEESAWQIPDAKQRLAYIVQMTEQAASKVLNAVDIARPLQDGLLARSKSMAERWERMFTNRLSVEEFKLLAAETRAFFQEAPGQLEATNRQLTDIVVAQDFQDLTGQVIRKVVDIVEGFETQLLQILVEALPAERKAEVSVGLMNGPVVSADGRLDVVSTQSQVDELLESLGF